MQFIKITLLVVSVALVSCSIKITGGYHPVSIQDENQMYFTNFEADQVETLKHIDKKLIAFNGTIDSLLVAPSGVLYSWVTLDDQTMLIRPEEELGKELVGFDIQMIGFVEPIAKELKSENIEGIEYDVHVVGIHDIAQQRLHFVSHQRDVINRWKMGMLE